jgi:hypothetical protein
MGDLYNSLDRNFGSAVRYLCNGFFHLDLPWNLWEWLRFYGDWNSFGFVKLFGFVTLFSIVRFFLQQGAAVRPALFTTPTTVMENRFHGECTICFDNNKDQTMNQIKSVFWVWKRISHFFLRWFLKYFF